MTQMIACVFAFIAALGLNTVAFAEMDAHETTADLIESIDLWTRVRDSLVEDRIRLGDALNSNDASDPESKHTLVPVILRGGVRVYRREAFMDRIRVAGAMASLAMTQSDDARERVAEELARAYGLPTEVVLWFAAKSNASRTIAIGLASDEIASGYSDEYWKMNESIFRNELSNISDAIDDINAELREFEAELSKREAEKPSDLADQWRGHGIWPIPAETDRLKFTEVLLLGEAPSSVCLKYRRDYIGKHTEPKWSRRIQKQTGKYVCIACPVGWHIWNPYDHDPTCSDKAR